MFTFILERSEFFIELFLEHLLISSIAIFIIACLGSIIGILMTQNKHLAKIALVVINFVYTIPAIALFGILVTITGIGDKSAIIALVIYGLLPVVRSVYIGIIEVDEEIIEAAIGMGSTRKQLLFKIQVPLALPVIFSGFRTMVVMTIALGGIASFIGAGGLGVAIYRGITTYLPEMIFAGSFLVAVLAAVSDMLLGVVEKSIRKKIFGYSKLK